MRNRSRAVKAAIAAVPTLAIALGTGLPATATATSTAPKYRSLKGLTCMPKPSACGFPDATNTGVPPGTPLTPSGSVTLSTNGQVFSNRDVHGSILVTASNVTIERVRVTGRSEVPLIYTKSGTNTVIRDVEINMDGEDAGKGIAFDNYTAQRVWFHNGLDCAHQGRNVTITDSFCDLPKLAQGSSAHADGFQSDGGGSYVFRHNTIRNPNEQTSAILMSTNTSPISNVVIDHNLMSGGGYTVYCGTDEGGMTPNLTYTNNVISREYFAKGGYWGATTWCDRAATSGNNVWDGSYVPPPGTVLPGSAPAGGPAASGNTKARGRLRMVRAKRKTRAALREALGKRLVRSRSSVHVGCKRRSVRGVACRVAWRQGPKGHPFRRFKGKVVVKRVGARRAHYVLRVHRWSGDCDCRRTIKRSGTV